MNIKGREVVGQIQLSNKCMKEMFLLRMKIHFLWKTYKIFCLKELSRAIIRGPIILGGNCPGRNCPGGQLSWDQFSRGLLSDWQLSGGNFCGATVLEPYLIIGNVPNYFKNVSVNKCYFKIVEVILLVTK